MRSPNHLLVYNLRFYFALLFLPTPQFDQLLAHQPELSHILQNNLARELALRIRLANQSLALLQ